MSVSAQKSFEVVVEGTYYAGTRNNKIPRRFSPETFIVFDLQKALHTIQRQLLAERLQRKYEDYTGWRECRIVSSAEVKDGKAVVSTKDTPIAQMTLQMLSDFVQLERLDVLVHNFGTVAQARAAVADAFDDKKLQAKQKREAAAVSAKANAENEALRQANSTPAPKTSKPTVVDDGRLEDLDEPLVETKPAVTGLEDLE